MKPINSTFAKRAVAALIAGAGIVGAAAWAMPDSSTDTRPGCAAHAWQGMHSRMQERRAERLAELKDKLRLAPEQEAAWTTFAAAMQPGLRHAGADRQAVRAEFARLSTPERLDRMQALADMRRARMAERAQAIKAFYAQLSPGQKKVFDAEAMPGPGHRGHGLHRLS